MTASNGKIDPVTYELIEFQHTGYVASIVFNRPEAVNAVSFEMLAELESAMSLVEGNADIRVLVLTGRGRAFCAGADLKGVSHDGPADRTPDAFVKRIQAVMNRIRALQFPVIAGLNGITMAGGLEFALCADIIVAAETARIGDCHVNYGVIPGAGGAAILPGIVGTVVGKFLLFTGEAPRASELIHTGLLAKVYPDDTFQAELGALAEKIAEKSPLGLKIIKRIVGEALRLPQSDALQLEIDANATYSLSEDMREGLAAFSAKRRPVFVGR